MSSGYTDTLLLEACVPWWPNRGDIGVLSTDVKDEEYTFRDNVEPSESLSSSDYMTFFSLMTCESVDFDPVCVCSESHANCGNDSYSSSVRCQSFSPVVHSNRKSYGLSRLGRVTLALEAELVFPPPHLSSKDTVLHHDMRLLYVQVRNPLNSTYVRMRVFYLPEGCVTPKQVKKLFQSGLVRIVPASVIIPKDDLYCGLWTVATVAEPSCTEDLRVFCNSPPRSNESPGRTAFSYLLSFLPSLLPHTVSRAEEILCLWLTNYSKNSCKFFVEDFSRKRYLHRMPTTSSLLTMTLCGPVGSGKKLFLRYLYREFCQLFKKEYQEISVRGIKRVAEEKCVFCYVPFRRSVNMASLLAMEEDEAVAIVRQVMSPPPVASIPVSSTLKSSEGEDSINLESQFLSNSVHWIALPLLWITIHHVDLLSYTSNSIAAGVSCEILKCLEELRKRTPIFNYRTTNGRTTVGSVTLPSPVVVWATTLSGNNISRPITDPSLEGGIVSPSTRLSTSLLSLLMNCGSASMLQMTHPTLEERYDFLSRACKDEFSDAEGSLEPDSSVINSLIRNGNLDMLSTDAFFSHCLKIKQRSELSSWHIMKENHTQELNVACEPRDLCTGLYGLDGVISLLDSHFIWPVTHLHLLKTFHVPCVKGALLYGPSGSGKTALLSLLAQLLAKHNYENTVTHSKVGWKDTTPPPFTIHIMIRDGLTLIEKEVGKTEENIANLFHEARAKAPTVLFLDNIDALAPPRGQNAADSHAASDRMLSTLLVEMDGLGSHTPSKSSPFESLVVLVASAPSLDRLDPAVYRAGRLDLHVPLTTPSLDESITVMVKRIWAVLEKTILHNIDKEPLNGEGHPVQEWLKELSYKHLLSRCMLKDQKEHSGSSSVFSSPPSAAIVLADIRDITLYLMAFTRSKVDHQKGEDVISFSVERSIDNAKLSTHNSFCMRVVEEAFNSLTLT